MHSWMGTTWNFSFHYSGSQLESQRLSTVKTYTKWYPRYARTRQIIDSIHWNSAEGAQLGIESVSIKSTFRNKHFPEYCQSIRKWRKGEKKQDMEKWQLNLHFVIPCKSPVWLGLGFRWQHWVNTVRCRFAVVNASEGEFSLTPEHFFYIMGQGGKLL